MNPETDPVEVPDAHSKELVPESIDVFALNARTDVPALRAVPVQGADRIEALDLVRGD